MSSLIWQLKSSLPRTPTPWIKYNFVESNARFGDETRLSLPPINWSDRLQPLFDAYGMVVGILFCSFSYTELYFFIYFLQCVWPWGIILTCLSNNFLQLTPSNQPASHFNPLRGHMWRRTLIGWLIVWFLSWNDLLLESRRTSKSLLKILVVSSLMLLSVHRESAFVLYRKSARIARTNLPSLWSPYVIGQTIIFSSCFFFLLSSSFFFLFFSSPNLSGRRLDVYHTLAHGVALVRI